MTLGEKLKSLRLRENMTQEEMAEKLNVSRSAIAKWESDGGVPDINNLKYLSRCFNVSIDELLDEDNENKIVMEKTDDQVAIDYFSEYVGQRCDIELTGWNDGVSGVYITGYDKEFVYYTTVYKSDTKRGSIGRKYITNINVIKSSTKYICNMDTFNINYFVGKQVKVEQACKEGLIKGFFDFSNDDYMNVVISSISETQVILVSGRELDICNITKIEEL